jgi:complex III assembly factor LYRM7
LLTIATGDTHLLHAAQAQARGAFRENASLAPEDPLAVKAITHAKEVSAILRENIVQGKNVGDNKYSMCLFHPVYADFFVRELTIVAELRIHAETERGDNDSIKMPNGQKVKIEGKKCCS